jgi:hypothetical protein
MAQAAKATRQNRTITVDFHDEATYAQLLGDTKAFIECVLAFLLALGFQLTHQATCDTGCALTRHSHYARVRLGGLTIWRVQCTRCKAVCTVLPHFVLRYRQMRPEVARDALLATHGCLSLEWCAAICHISPMALYRVICALGTQRLVAVLTRCSPGVLSTPRAQHTPRQAGGPLRPGTPGVALDVSHLAAPLSPAHKLTGSGVGAAAAPLCRSHHRDRW